MVNRERRFSWVNQGLQDLEEKLRGFQRETKTNISIDGEEGTYLFVKEGNVAANITPTLTDFTFPSEGTLSKRERELIEVLKQHYKHDSPAPDMLVGMGVLGFAPTVALVSAGILVHPDYALIALFPGFLGVVGGGALGNYIEGRRMCPYWSPQERHSY